MITITDHANERIKDRLGLPKSARLASAQRAYEKGKTHADAKGKLKRFLDGCWIRHKTSNNVRLYGEHIWFFKDETLITIYEIPRDMRKGV